MKFLIEVLGTGDFGTNPPPRELAKQIGMVAEEMFPDEFGDILIVDVGSRISRVGDDPHNSSADPLIRIWANNGQEPDAHKLAAELTHRTSTIVIYPRTFSFRPKLA